MREDMFKVIVERPRSGRAWASKSKLRYVKGDAPARMTGKKIVTYSAGGRKFLNENLAPLKRYLRRQKGRKWDDVFSEICAQLDTGSTVKMHVREHLGDFIVRDVRVDEAGHYWAAGHWGAPIGPTLWAALYVDPVDGIIKETSALCRKLRIPTRREFYKERRRDYFGDNTQHNVRHLTGRTYAVKKTGIWYAVDITDHSAQGSANDMSKAIWNALADPETSRDTKIYILSKKQMPKKQLRKYGFVNDKGDYYG